MSFSTIQDQAAAIRLLQNALARERVPNGLLFWGPAGVGKGLTAFEMAKAINCLEAEADACGTCLACRKVAHGNHPDVKEVLPSGRGRIIGVDTVDFISELSAYRPFEGRWRAFIIQEAHRMNEAAQNHFLKTLEEPPSKTVYMLITDFPRMLLPTIRSRCQGVRFGALRPETITKLLLRDHDLPEDRAAAVAAVSHGQMSRALDLVHSERREKVLNVTERLAKGEDPMAVAEEFSAFLRGQQEAIRSAAKAQATPEAAADLSREDLEAIKQESEALAAALVRRDLMEYLYLMQSWYRDELVYEATGQSEAVLNRDQITRLQASAGKASADRLAAIDKAWLYIERNLNIDRVFRDLFFALAA